MRRLASLLLLLAGCAPPLGAPPSIEPHLPARAQTSSCEPAGATLWDEAILRLPALLEHEQVDRAAERFEILRSWFPARGRATVWLQAEGGVACHPVDLGLTLERVRGRRRTDVTEGDDRLQTMTSVVLEPWGISAWFQSRDGVREGDDWRWAPYEHAVLPMHTAKYLSAIDDRVAVYGGTTYRLTTTCIRRETRDQACTQGRSRRCPVCVEIGLRRIDATRARGIPLELPSTVIREDDVDCSQRCPGEPDASRRAELNAVLATRVFYRDAGDGPRVYRDEEASRRRQASGTRKPRRGMLFRDASPDRRHSPPWTPVPDGSRSFVSASPDLDRVAALFRAHFGFVRRVLRRCGVAEADLDDAVQEVFLVVHRRIDDFEGRAAETTWLYAVAVRVASTLRRSATRERARREKAGAQMHGGGEADPERELSRQEAAALLDGLLEELDGTKRTVFVLAELEGVPVPEIAQIMDANLRTTHSRLRLARQRFNAALERHRAQESGRMRRATLRALAERGEPRRPEPSQTRAACAALMLRISQGATPMAISWTPVVAAATAKGFWLPFALTLGLGAGGLGVVATRGQPEVPATKAPTVAPEREVVAASEPAPHPVPARELETPEPLPTAAEPARVAPKAKAKPTPTESVLEVSTLEAETALIEQARAKLRAADPDAALRLLAQHRAQYPQGLLAAERTTTRVKALCKAGRRTEAERVAVGNSSLQAVVDVACE